MIRPISWNGAGWVLAGMPEPRPLYRLPELGRRPQERVYVTEGEKAAEAGRQIDLLCTTSPHGSSSAAKADWSPLAGRDVVLLPDHDEPGHQYARDVAELLLALMPPATVRIVNLPDLPPKGDLYDWLDNHDSVEPEMLRARLDRLVEAAAVVTNEKAPASTGPALFPVSSDAAEPLLQCLDDLEEREIQWLWPQRVPAGCLTLLVGKPGEGKSFLTTDMAARVSTGAAWPDGTPGPSGSVLFICDEDDPGATIHHF